MLFIRFILGALIGSFLNVVALRHRSGLTLGGRSQCASCAKTLSWWELLPIVSFLALRGRCASCKTKISSQYPLVELWTGLLFMTLDPVFWIPFCLYVVIVIYDLRHKIIPDTFVYISIAIVLLVRIMNGGSMGDWLVGPILFAVFALGWLVSHGRALGFGDAKLVLSLGLLLGASFGISAVVLAFWIGAAVTIPLVFSGYLLGRKSLTMKSEIPFAPFLVLGAWGTLLFHLDLFHLASF